MKNPVVIGCLGCLGLLTLVIMAGIAANLLMSPAQRAALNREVANSAAAAEAPDDAKIDAFFKAMTDLRMRLPTGDALREQGATGLGVAELPYSAVDAGWFASFVSGRFVPSGPSVPPWYRDQDFVNVAAEAVPAPGMPSRDTSGLAGNIDDLARVPYVVVIVPQEERKPVLNDDGKTFEPGMFRGWAVLIDWKTRRPIGTSAVAATSSPDILSLRIAGLGNDLKTAMEKDFTDRFWVAVNAAVARAAGHPGTPDFASHQPYYRDGSSES